MLFKLKHIIIFITFLFVIVSNVYANQKEASDAKKKAVESALDNWDAVIGRAKKVSREKSWDAVYERVKNTSIKSDRVEPSILSDKFARENNDSLRAKKHEFKISTEIYYQKSEEGGFHNFKTKSTVYAINPVYSYRPNKEDFMYLPFLNYYSLDGRYAFGNIDIERENEESVGVSCSDADNTEFEMRGLLGKEYFKDNFSFILFSGLGYKETEYKVNVDYMFNHKMERYYVPLGLNYKKYIDKKWNVSLSGEYDVMVYGHYKLTPSAYPTFGQSSGYGMRGSIMLQRKTENFDLFFGPIIRYWDVDGTETLEDLKKDDDTYIGVGRTKIYNYGFKMGINF